MTNSRGTQSNTPRPPIVVVMGHIDHGKSTLLDYIRKTNVVDGEAGGITQHLSAYEVKHKDAEGKDRSITFLDTPGHEAFVGMRSRGAQSADIAILVVSAEDSVKAQTLEAWKTIMEYKLPYIVAINKIDKPNANPEKVKLDLAEKGIYLEGYGGDISFAEISAKKGTGIDSLLEIILLVADMNEIVGEKEIPAEGVVIESRLDARRGITATLIIRNGTLERGMYVRAGTAIAGTRIMEDFHLKTIDEASLSQPVRITGWDKIPEVGRIFHSYKSKKEAEEGANISREKTRDGVKNEKTEESAEKMIPVIIRADTAGTADAVLSEIRKLELPTIKWQVLSCGVGTIGENDIKTAAISSDSIILGFNTKVDPRAKELNEQTNVNVQIFDIIYKLSEYLETIIKDRRPRKEAIVVSGELKIQKAFSRTKDRQVVGGLVLSGEIETGNEVRINRRDSIIGEGTIVGLEQNKNKTKSVASGAQCGVLIEARIEIAPGDIVEAITKKFE